MKRRRKAYYSEEDLERLDLADELRQIVVRLKKKPLLGKDREAIARDLQMTARQLIKQTHPIYA